MFTVVHKHYSVDAWKEFADNNKDILQVHNNHHIKVGGHSGSAGHLVFSRLVRQPKSPFSDPSPIYYYCFRTNCLAKWLDPNQFLLVPGLGLAKCSALSGTANDNLIRANINNYFNFL